MYIYIYIYIFIMYIYIYCIDMFFNHVHPFFDDGELIDKSQATPEGGDFAAFLNLVRCE